MTKFLILFSVVFFLINHDSFAGYTYLPNIKITVSVNQVCDLRDPKGKDQSPLKTYLAGYNNANAFDGPIVVTKPGECKDLSKDQSQQNLEMAGRLDSITSIRIEKEVPGFNETKVMAYFGLAEIIKNETEHNSTLYQHGAKYFDLQDPANFTPKAYDLTAVSLNVFYRITLSIDDHFNVKTLIYTEMPVRL